MGIAFSRPEYLALVPVVATALWLSARGSFAGLKGRRRVAAWGLRTVLMLSIIFALAGLQIVRPSREMVVVFALDGSHSVSPADRERALQFVKNALRSRPPRDRGMLVVFGKDAVVEKEALRRPSDVEGASTPSGDHTNIAGALRLSLGLLPAKSAGRVVLLSDGNENTGRADQEVLLARSRRVPVDVVPLSTRAAGDTVVRELVLPADARQGERIPVRVVVEAPQPREGMVTVLADGKPVLRQAATLAAGPTSLQLPIALSQPGFRKIDVLLETKGEELAQNNVATGFVRVSGEPRVLLVDSTPSDAAELGRALELQDIGLETGGPALLPTNPAELEQYDALLLSNVPAYNLDGHQMSMFRDATRDLGVGLGMIGGEYSFGAGGYYQTPVEEALPVSMDVTKHRALPSSAVVIVIDTSGSMGMIEDGVEKIQLAAEAASAVVDLLQPYDSIGVFAVDTNPTAVCRLRRVGSKGGVKTDIRSLRAGGGGIYVYTGLSAAYSALKTNNASIRHIILLADGNDSEQQEGCLGLVQAMVGEKITTTAISLGQGVDVPFLQQVAKHGRGQFYVAQRTRDLKKIFTREALTVAKSVLVEEQFRARPRDRSAVIAGIGWPSAPPLLGYVATTPKGLADIPLVSHKDDPVLAHWQYGLGRSIAFTSDAKSHWAAPWMAWGQFPKFWGQVVRWCLRQQASGALHARIEPDGDQARITVEAVDDTDTLLNGLEVRVRVNTPDGGRDEALLAQTGPGRYEGAFETPRCGAYVAGISAKGPAGFEATRTAGYAVPYPPDFADTVANQALLKRICRQSGGRVLSGPEEVFLRPARPPQTSRDIWRFLLWLAAIVLPLDVAVRRLILAPEDVAAFVEPVRALLSRFATRSRPETPRARAMGRLLDRKATVESERHEAQGEPGDLAQDTTGLPEARPEKLPPTPRVEPRGETPSAPPRPAPTSPQSDSIQTETTTSRLLERKRKRRQTEEED